MKVKTHILLVFFFISFSAWGQEGMAYRILVDGKWGAVSADGAVVVEPEYDYIYSFVNGMTVVRRGGFRDGKRAYVRSDGVFITEFEFDKAYHFFGPLAVVEKDGREGFIDRDGRLVTEIGFDYAEDFRRELALVRTGSWSDGAWGIVLADGSMPIAPRYQRLSHTADPEVLIYQQNEKFGLINTQGTVISPATYDNLYASGDFAIGVSQKDGLAEMVIVDLQGGIRYSPANKSEQLRFIVDGFAVVNVLGKYGLVDIEGERFIEPRYDGVWISPGSMAIAGVGSGRNRRYGIFTTTGEEISPPVFQWVSFFNEDGVALIMQDGLYGCINTSGQIFVKPRYSQMRQFSEGFAAVLEEGKWGFVDVYGNVTIEPSFDWAYDFSEGLAVVREGEWDGGKRGYIDTNGELVIEMNYDWAYSFENGVAHVAFGRHYDGTFGYIDREGNYIWEPTN